MVWTNHSRLRVPSTARTCLGIWLLLHLLAFAVTPFLHLALQSSPSEYHACCASRSVEGNNLQAAHPPGHQHANCSICQQILHGQQLQAGDPASSAVWAGNPVSRLATVSLLLPTRPELHAHGARGPPVS